MTYLADHVQLKLERQTVALRVRSEVIQAGFELVLEQVNAGQVSAAIETLASVRSNAWEAEFATQEIIRSATSGIEGLR
jgi:hypothetical protein